MKTYLAIEIIIVNKRLYCVTQDWWKRSSRPGFLKRFCYATTF